MIGVVIGKAHFPLKIYKLALSVLYFILFIYHESALIRHSEKCKFHTCKGEGQILGDPPAPASSVDPGRQLAGL